VTSHQGKGRVKIRYDINRRLSTLGRRSSHYYLSTFLLISFMNKQLLDILLLAVTFDL